MVEHKVSTPASASEKIDYSQVPIIQCSYMLALSLQKLILQFPRSVRFQLGDRLAAKTQDFVEGIVKANFVRDPGLRFRALDSLSGELFTIRLTVRMAKDLRAFSPGQFTDVNAQIEDIQKQLTGWSKWTQSKVPGNKAATAPVAAASS